MNKLVKKLFIVIAFLNPLNQCLFYSNEALALSKTSGEIYETKIDSDNDNKVDYIILKQQRGSSVYTVGLSISNSVVDKIDISDESSSSSLSAKYILNNGRYELVYNYQTSDKMFYQWAPDYTASGTNADVCVNCKTPENPLKDQQRPVESFLPILNLLEKNASKIAELKQKFPLDKSCLQDPPDKMKYKNGAKKVEKLNFENEIYNQIINLSEDKEAIACLTKENPIWGAEFAKIPEALYNAAPKKNLTLQCAENSLECKCDKDNIDSCIKDNCLKRTREDKDGNACDKKDPDCTMRLITRGVYVESIDDKSKSVGQRVIMLSNSLRIKTLPITIKQDQQKLKLTLAHELLHSFGCKHEGQTECLIEKCFGANADQKKECRPDDYRRTPIDKDIGFDFLNDKTTENPLTAGKESETAKSYYGNSVERVERKNGGRSQTLSASSQNKPTTTTPTDFENANNSQNELPSTITGPLKTTPRDLTMPSNSIPSPSGGTVATRVIRDGDESPFYKRVFNDISPVSTASASTSTGKRESGARATAKTTSVPKSSVQPENKLKFAATTTTSSSDRKTEVDLKAPAVKGRTVSSVGTAAEGINPIDAGVVSSDTNGSKTSSTTITNITNTSTTTISNQGSTSSAKVVESQAQRNDSSTRAIQILNTFIQTSDPEPIADEEYRVVREAITSNNKLKDWLKSKGIRFVAPDFEADTRIKNPKATLIDKGNRIIKTKARK